MRLLFTDTDSVMVQIFKLQDPLHMAKANLNGAALFDVAGKSKDPERDLSALCSGARQGHRGDGPAGQARRRDLPRQDPGVRGPALQDVYSISRSSPTAHARRSASVPKKAVTNVRHLEYREALEEGSERRAAFAQLRSRARDRRGDRREEVALALQRQGLRPRRSQLAAAGTLAQPGGGADAGRLRSARLRALRPRDGVPRGAPASGARSDTAAAAEPLLGVDCRNLPSSRFLAFSIMLMFDPPQLLKEMTSSAAFRRVQAWRLEMGGR